MDKNLHLLIQHDLDPNIFSITLFQKVWWPQKIHMLQTNLPISWRKLEVVFQMTLGTLWKFIYKVLLYFFSMRKYPFLKAQYTLINIPWNCVIIKLKVGIFVCFCMTDFWLVIFLKEFVDHECVGRMKPTNMLNELSNMMKLQYNMSFLEWIFGKCGESKLVKECQEFSAEHQFQLECFNTKFTPCKN